MDSPRVPRSTTMTNMRMHLRNLSIFSTKSSKASFDDAETAHASNSTQCSSNTPLDSGICSAPVLKSIAASPADVVEVSDPDGPNIISTVISASTSDGANINSGNLGGTGVTLGINGKTNGRHGGVDSSNTGSGPVAVDPGFGVVGDGRINIGTSSSTERHGSDTHTSPPDVGFSASNSEVFSKMRLGSPATAVRLLGDPDKPLDPNSRELADTSPYGSPHRDSPAVIGRLRGRSNESFDPGSSDLLEEKRLKAPRRDASAAATQLLGRSNNPFDPDSSEFADGNPYEVLGNGTLGTSSDDTSTGNDDQVSGASPVTPQTEEQSGPSKSHIRTATNAFDDGSSNCGADSLYQTPAVVAINTDGNNILGTFGSSPFPAHYTSTAPESSPSPPGPTAFPTIPKRRYEVGNGEELNWQLRYKDSVGSFQERKSSKTVPQSSSNLFVSNVRSTASAGHGNNDNELPLHEQENMLDIIAELYDAACGNPKGGDLHDSLMMQNQFFVLSPRFAELPTGSPTRHMHILDWTRFLTMADSNHIIGYLKPRLCDAVATVLHETDPKSLAAFLDEDVESFEWLHDFGNSAFRTVKSALILREGNEVICGTYTNVGFRYIWDRLVKSRIHFNGKWSEVWAGAGGFTRPTADGLLGDYTPLAVGASENATDAHFALWMGRQLAASFIEMERSSNGRQLKIWQFGGEQCEALEWEADGAVTRATTRGYGTFVPVAGDEE